MSTVAAPTKIAIGLLYLFLVINIALAGISLATPDKGGEFAALSNFVTWITSLLVGGMSVAILLSTPALFKQKRWAYILSIVLVILLMPILAFSDLTGLGFTVIPGSPISLTKELLPIAVLVFLILGRKDFRKI